MTWFSRKLFSTLANRCLVAIVGFTALRLITVKERPERFPSKARCEPSFLSNNRWDWQRATQRVVGLGMGMMLFVDGAVRNSVERMFHRNWFKASILRLGSLPDSISSSGLLAHALRHAGYGMLVGSLFVLFKHDKDNHGRGSGCDDDEDDHFEEIGDDDDDDDGGGDDNDINVLVSTIIVIRPMEDYSVGAEPAERPMLGGNQSVVIRNDVMVTIQDALASATALDVSDHTIVNEEQSYSDDDGNSSEDSQRLSETNSIEHEFFDVAPDLDEGIPTETEKKKI